MQGGLIVGVGLVMVTAHFTVASSKGAHGWPSLYIGPAFVAWGAAVFLDKADLLTSASRRFAQTVYLGGVGAAVLLTVHLSYFVMSHHPEPGAVTDCASRTVYSHSASGSRGREVTTCHVKLDSGRRISTENIFRNRDIGKKVTVVDTPLGWDRPGSRADPIGYGAAALVLGVWGLVGTVRTLREDIRDFRRGRHPMPAGRHNL